MESRHSGFGRERILVAPGPTQVPPDVLEVLGRQVLHHRSPEFRAALRRVRSGLQQIAESENPVLLLACTGTAAMESAVINVADPADTVLVVSAGYFGERWVELAESLRLQRRTVAVRVGRGAVAG